MIGSLVGFQWGDTVELTAYIHKNIIAPLVAWFNDNNLEKEDSGAGLRWKEVNLDADAATKLAAIEKSNLLLPLFIGRVKVGYAIDSETQAFYQGLLKQEFCYRLIRGWRC